MTQSFGSHHKANTPGERVTAVHQELIRLTLSELLLPDGERADHMQVTLIELIGGGVGPAVGKTGDALWENGDGEVLC